MKCYYHENHDGVKEYYYAETRNQARKYFSENLVLPYIDVRVYRAQWADEYHSLTPLIRLQHGDSIYCWDCTNILDPDSTYYSDDKGRCRCSKCHAIKKVKGFFGRGE